MCRNLFSCKDKGTFVPGNLGTIGKEIVRGLRNFGT